MTAADPPHRRSRSRDAGGPRVDFVGIGAQKSASGSIFRALDAHPDIGGPLRTVSKEIDFFNFRWHYGVDWYERHFGDAPCNGEFSVLYLADLDSPQRMASYRPDMKLLVTLRDPVARAVSHHRHEIAEGRVPKALWAFEQAARRNPTYLEHSRYAEHLERWLRCFPREQLHIVFFEEMIERPDEEIARIHQFLEIDPPARPPVLDVAQNAPRLPRSELAFTAIRRLRAASRTRFGDGPSNLLRRAGASRLVRDIVTRPVVDVVPAELLEVSVSSRRELVRDAARLPDLLGLDLPQWPSLTAPA